VECSIIKVWASEMVDYVVDETLQIYGGYGFVEEYPAERAYRDARINRIFEGTTKSIVSSSRISAERAMSGQLPLMPAIKKLMDEVLSGPSMGDDLEGPLAEERKLVSPGKKLGLFAAGAATQNTCRHSGPAGNHGRYRRHDIEPTLWNLPCCAREKIAETKGEPSAASSDCHARVYLSQAMEKVESAAKKVIAAVADGDMLRTQLAILRRLASTSRLTPRTATGRLRRR